MTRSEAIRRQFAFLENQSGVSVSASEYPGYASNCDVKYLFLNGSSIKIWTDRSDVYVEAHQSHGKVMDIAKLCGSSATYFDEYLNILNNRWKDTIAPWLGVEACK